MAKNSGKWAIGAIIAGVTGYVAGVLTAPKSGKETRQDIKYTANKTKKEAEIKLKELLSELSVKIDSAKSRGANLKGTAETELKGAVAKAAAAKEKVREVISAMHDGEADDPELKKAIDDAKKALKHIEKYAKK